MNLSKKNINQLTLKKKRAKRNTWYRKLRAWDIRLDRRMRQRDAISETVDQTERKCSNCGHVYVGRVCPQCGQIGTWKRYTWLQALINFLDIWGLGNRPMFRTLKELFWRPGYMIRDYLEGHRQFYFPPFKLLAVTVALSFFANWVTGGESKSIIRTIIADYDLKEIVSSMTGPFSTMANTMMDFAEFLGNNMLYEWLFFSVIIVLCIWCAFRPYRRYNFVETYIFLIFVLAQQLISTIPDTIVTAIFTFVKDHTVLHLGRSTAIPIHSIHGFLDVVLDRVKIFYSLFIFFLFVLDFRQFYGLKWKTTIIRLLYALVIFCVASCLLIGFFDSLGNQNGGAMLLIIAYGVLVFLGFYVVGLYLSKNKEKINSAVSWATKLLNLLMLFIFIPSVDVRRADYNLFWQVLALVVSMLLFAAASRLPIVLYKRYHKTWLSWLAVPVIYALTFLCFRLMVIY